MSTAPEFNPEDNISAELEKEFVRPADKFDGKELWPLSRGTRLLLAQISSEEDTVIYRALAFIFIHQKRTEKTAHEDMARHVIDLAWRSKDFRAEIVKFRAELGERGDEVADRLEQEALDVYEEAISREMRSRVTALPSGSTAGVQKKTATTQTPRPGKRPSSRKSSIKRRKK